VSFPDAQEVCTKIPYLGKKQAKAALRSARESAEKGNGKRAETRTYLCPECSFWHLTSSPTPHKLRS